MMNRTFLLLLALFLVFLASGCPSTSRCAYINDPQLCSGSGSDPDAVKCFYDFDNKKCIQSENFLIAKECKSYIVESVCNGHVQATDNAQCKWSTSTKTCEVNADRRPSECTRLDPKACEGVESVAGICALDKYRKDECVLKTASETVPTYCTQITRLEACVGTITAEGRFSTPPLPCRINASGNGCERTPPGKCKIASLTQTWDDSGEECAKNKIETDCTGVCEWIKKANGSGSCDKDSLGENVEGACATALDKSSCGAVKMATGAHGTPLLNQCVFE